jgi:alkaline phosphatase D
VGASAAGLVALGALPGCASGRVFRFATYPFALGVASGDPASDGVVLWARLAVTSVREAGVGTDPVQVRWEVSEDDRFSRIVRRGSAEGRPELGHSVHVEVDGLRPGREYFYRMIAGGEVSPVGRTKTTPDPTSEPDRIDFAFLSCQHFEQGYYTGLRHLSEESLDLIVHLGDYIYEGEANDGRPRRHEGAEECLTLEQYRARYATYRGDVDLQAAHAAAPWVVSPDDHEVDNNWAGVHPEDDQSPEAFLLRRAAAFQAYYEFMPLRRSSMPAGPAMQIYRRLSFGRLLDINVLDTRQYRSDQPCEDTVGPTCAQHAEPGRTLLGASQRAWLFDGLGESRAQWNALAQQVLVAHLRGRNSDGDEMWSMDKWDGYPVEREAVLDVLGDSGAANPVVLTGDIHSSWVTRLLRDFDDERSEAVGTEFVCTSISSGGDGQAMTAWGENAVRENAHVDFHDGRRGYVVASVTPERWTSIYRVVPVVEEPNGPVETLARFVVESGRAGAERL